MAASERNRFCPLNLLIRVNCACLAKSPAESQWRAVLAQMPDLTAAWLGLGELFLDQGRIADAEAILHRLENMGQREAASRLRANLDRT